MEIPHMELVFGSHLKPAAMKRRHVAAAATAASAASSAAALVVVTAATPPAAAAAATATATPYRILVNVDALTEHQHERLRHLHALLAAFPSLDGGITPEAAALDAFQPLLQWLRANLFLHGDAFELNLDVLLNIVQEVPDRALAAVTPFVLAAACVELGIADTPTASWCAAHMGRPKLWLVRGCMWDLRSSRLLRSGAAWHVDTERRAFYEALVEHARNAGLPVCTHGHLCVLPVAREYYALQRTEAPAGSTRVRKAAGDVALHTFTLVRNAVVLLQARSADSLDGLAAPLRALTPVRARISKGLAAFLDAAAPSSSVDAAFTEELRALCLPYAWMFGCAHGVAEDTFEVIFAPGRARVWEHALVFWDAL